MTDLEKQIEAKIADAAEKFCDLNAPGGNWSAGYKDRLDSFKSGARFLLPLLLKAIEQRDIGIDQDVINDDNKELMELLK